MPVDLGALIEAEPDDAPYFAVVGPFSPARPAWDLLFGADHVRLVCGCVHHLPIAPGLIKPMVVIDVAHLSDDQVARLAGHAAEGSGHPAWEVEATMRREGGFLQDITGAVVARSVAEGRELARRPLQAGGH